MFWFLFHAVADSIMLALDVACLVIVWRLTKKRSWRFIAALFLGAQTLGHLAFMCGLRWQLYFPRSFFVAGYMWHFFGLAIVGTILLLIFCVRSFRKISTGRKKRSTAAQSAALETSQGNRREFLGALATFAPPLFTVGMTGIALEQLNQFRVRRFTLALPSLPRDLEGLTIAHVSDVHVGRLTNGRVLKRMVETTNSLKPDLIAVTGDLIDFEISDLSGAMDLVKAMDPRYGLWMIEGNHDLFDDGAEFERRVKASGIPLLLNESAIVNLRGHPLQIFGLTWTDGSNRYRDSVTNLQLSKLMQQRRPEAFPLLLAHHPHAFDAAASMDIPLTLAGHTHGGQLMLDQSHGVGPILFRYWTGLYQRSHSQMIVSNGVGNMFPIRINAPAEIVHITLRTA